MVVTVGCCQARAHLSLGSNMHKMGESSYHDAMRLPRGLVEA